MPTATPIRRVILVVLDGLRPDAIPRFGLAHLAAEDLAETFVELRPHLGRCRFRDCRHDSEPGCALLGALAAGAVHPRRWEHFRAIRSEIAEARRLNPGW